jgi:chemotaxis protein methyltransferase CheR
MLPAETLQLPAASFGKTIPELTEDEFHLFQALVLRESGIHLGQKNRAMIVSRLWKRLNALDLQSFSAYYRLVKADPRELIQMLDCISTNETHFFREPAAFDCLREHIFPEWQAAAENNQRSRTLRVWSAACSSGEEPYSLAMTLLSHFPASDGWKVEVFATDLSTKVLARASAGVWPAEKISTVPLDYQKRFLLKGFGPEKGKIKVTEELRETVKFQRLNLQHEPYPVVTPFDLIFCRNVLIYFQWETKLRVVNQLGKHLAPNGYLFLGHAESLHGVTDKLQSVTPKIIRPPKNSATRSSALCILQRRSIARRDQGKE